MTYMDKLIISSYVDAEYLLLFFHYDIYCRMFMY